MRVFPLSSFFFFFNDTATTEIYTLSLHDALPISGSVRSTGCTRRATAGSRSRVWARDRKSTRLNSSHLGISYAVFCLKKKKQTIIRILSKYSRYVVIPRWYFCLQPRRVPQ